MNNDNKNPEVLENDDVETKDELTLLKEQHEKDLEEQKAKYKKLIDKASHEAKQYKDSWKAAEDKLKSQLPEDERKAKEREERYKALEEENERLKKEALISQRTAFYQSIGFDINRARETAEAFASGDFETVDNNTRLAHEEFEKNIRADVVRENPHPKNVGEASSGTKISLAEAMRRANQGEDVDMSLVK